MRRARKVRTFDAAGFWGRAYAPQRAGLLRLAGAPEDEVAALAGMRYAELPADLRCEMELRGAGADLG